MKKAYSIDSDRIIIDYSSVYCETSDRLLRSKPFEDIAHRFLEKLQEKKTPIYTYLASSENQSDIMPLFTDLVAILRLLTTHTAAEVAEFNERYARLLRDLQMIFEFVEGLYDFWRSYQRYIVLSAPRTRLRTRQSIHHAQFIRSNETLRQLILRTYRTICENIIGDPFRVYRQLPAGAHVGLMTQHIRWDCPPLYQPLRRIDFIRLSLLEPPVIFNTRMNTRKGVFKQMIKNPLEDVDINPDHWFCYPAKIGNLLAFTYFHKSFMQHGAALTNLFELADHEDIYNQKPDIIMIFGGNAPKFSEDHAMFHHDEENNIMVGYVVNTESVDYFGYMKKMLLTLHNVIMIDRGLLPVHGAMVSIQLRSKRSANIIIVGDSGAGKSETLEAFRILAKDYISEMQIIFDDMGSIAWRQNAFESYGTEIGAFLRLDDLQPGYAFQQMDRSIFMNPHLVNARVILPVTTYRRITRGTPIEFFLYANNYEAVDDHHPAIEVFGSPADALQVFSEGKRLAKGTTAETGLVESYFANPFGAPQKREKHHDLAQRFMQHFFEQNIYVGQLRTQLGITGYEQEGPQLAAKALFEVMDNTV